MALGVCFKRIFTVHYVDARRKRRMDQETSDRPWFAGLCDMRGCTGDGILDLLPDLLTETGIEAGDELIIEAVGKMLILTLTRARAHLWSAEIGGF